MQPCNPTAPKYSQNENPNGNSPPPNKKPIHSEFVVFVYDGRNKVSLFIGIKFNLYCKINEFGFFF